MAHQLSLDSLHNAYPIHVSPEAVDIMRGAITLAFVSIFLQTSASAFIARRRHASTIHSTASPDPAELPSGRTLRVLRGGGSEDYDVDDKLEEGHYDDSFEENEENDYFDDEERDDEIEEADFEGDTLKARAIKAWSAAQCLRLNCITQHQVLRHR